MFDVCAYGGVDYCSQFNRTMSEYSLDQYDVPSDKAWVWAGVVFLTFAYFVFMALGSYVLEHKRYDAAVAAVAVVTSIVEDAKLVEEATTRWLQHLELHRI